MSAGALTESLGSDRGSAHGADRESAHAGPASSECMAPAHARTESPRYSQLTTRAIAPSVSIYEVESCKPEQGVGWRKYTSAGGERGKNSGALRKARREAEQAAEAERAASVRPDEGKYNHRSLFLFTLQNPIRQMLIRWIEWRFWDTKVICIIMLNTLTLAMFDCFDKPSMRACAQEDANLPPGPYGYCNKMTTGKYFPQYLGRDVQDILGKLFSAYFTFEMLVQVVAKGLCVGHKTFLTDAANWLDAFIVGVGIMDFVPSDSEGGSLSALRALRVLRPLRAVRVLFLKSPLH